LLEEMVAEYGTEWNMGDALISPEDLSNLLNGKYI